MKLITDEVIDKEHTKLWGELEAKYGDCFRVPKEESTRVSEIVRGMYVIQVWQREGGNGRSPRSTLGTYSISDETTQYLLARFGFPSQSEQKNEKSTNPAIESRKSKWGAFEKWARENRGKQFTTEELVTHSGFSYQTTLKYVSESPLFTKVKKGLWNVSAPDRE